MGKPAPCALCEAEAQRGETFVGQSLRYWYRCPECGIFLITSRADDHLQRLPSRFPQVLNLIGRLVQGGFTERPEVCWKTRREGALEDTEQISVLDIEDYLDRPIDHSRKQDGILRLLSAKMTRNPFDVGELNRKEIHAIGITDFAELTGWMEALHKRGLLEFENALTTKLMLKEPDPDSPRAKLTPDGWARVSELFGAADTRNCFVALSYRLPDEAAVRQAITEACLSTGWISIFADEQEYLAGVTDRIVSEINRSRFVIADLTGHRNGVYFEAGYAEGRRLPVIYTVRRDDAEKTHFDVQHINRIEWSDPRELQERLIARIGAVINR